MPTIILGYGLVREYVPTRWMNDVTVWDAHLERMPLSAMVPNLATMTRIGLLTPGSTAADHVISALSDRQRLRQSRLHPVALLTALRTYAAGKGIRGASTWTPASEIVEALEDAFYAAFAHVEPTSKRWLLALDVSGSMAGSMIAGVPNLSAREASAAMAIVTAATEPAHHIVAFSGRGFQASNYACSFGAWALQPNSGSGVEPLDVRPRQRLDDVTRTVAALPFGPTNCALPVLYALKRKMPVDVVVVYRTDLQPHGTIQLAAAECLDRASSTVGRLMLGPAGVCPILASARRVEWESIRVDERFTSPPT